MAAILDRHTMEDISVEDPPLEEVIADVFSHVKHKKYDPGSQKDGESVPVIAK